MKNYFILFILFYHLCVPSQENQGIIEYTASMNISHSEKTIKEFEQNKDIPQHIKSEVINMYKNAQPEQYELVFYSQESFFKHQRILNVDDAYNMGSKAGTNNYYTNKTKVIEYSTLGYIQKDPLKWEIKSERKKIGNFNCLKAIATEHLFSRKGYAYEKKITAWFIPEIALPFGPKNYSGLPGLVIEVIRDDYTIKATSINLNPEKGIKIIPPKDKKIITQEQANSIIKERSTGTN